MATEYYIGGDDGEHFSLWEKLYKGQEVPDYSATCSDCNEVVDTNLYLESHDQTSRRVIGECCYKKYPRLEPKETQNSSVETKKYSRILDFDSQLSQFVAKEPTKLNPIPGQTKRFNEKSESILDPTVPKETKETDAKIDPTTHFDEGSRKGISFEDVFNNEPGYMQYISTKPAEAKCFRNAIRYYQEHISDVKPFFEYGKYRGRTFENVYKENPGYFTYLQTKESSNPRYSSALEWYSQNKGETETPENVVPIGKWKGSTFDEVFDKAPDYLSWVVKNITDEKSPLYSLAKWVSENHGELKSPSKGNTTQQKTPVQATDGSVANYGKHNGKTVEEIWNEDPDYFRFISRKGNLNGNSEAFNRKAIDFYINKMGWEITDSSEFDGGKYSGRTFHDVHSENEDYYDWITSSYTGKSDSMIKAAIWFRLKTHKK
jgi:broad specificity phosphatase PhoE